MHIYKYTQTSIAIAECIAYKLATLVQENPDTFQCRQTRFPRSQSHRKHIHNVVSDHADIIVQAQHIFANEKGNYCNFASVCIYYKWLILI